MTDTVVPFPKSQCKIVSYFHCKRCLTERKRPDLAVGYTNDGRLQVWCEEHDAALGTFELKYPPFEPMRCAHCENPESA